MKINLFKGIQFKILKSFLLSILLSFFLVLFLVLKFLKIKYNVTYANWGNWANENLMLNTYILIIFFLMFILVTTMFFYIFTKKFIKQIDDINKKISIISEGNFSTIIPVTTDDEIGKLANNINIMSKKLEALIKKDAKNEKLKNDMISNISHDLRTPLTSVIGYVEIMKNLQYKDKTACDNCIDIILKKCDELKNLVEDLLEYTSINFKGINIKKEPISIKDVIEQIMIGFIPNLEKVKMSFSIKAPDGKIFIDGDMNLIIRLFENIINNSIFYGQNGKKIDVEIGEINNMVSIKIINYGKKISPEDQAYIFERFYRGEKSRNVNTGGKGMGLAIAKSIIDLHKGKINVDSDDNKTVFEILLLLSHEKL